MLENYVACFQKAHSVEATKYTVLEYLKEFDIAVSPADSAYEALEALLLSRGAWQVRLLSSRADPLTTSELKY